MLTAPSEEGLNPLQESSFDPDVMKLLDQILTGGEQNQKPFRSNDRIHCCFLVSISRVQSSSDDRSCVAQDLLGGGGEETCQASFR